MGNGRLKIVKQLYYIFNASVDHNIANLLLMTEELADPFQSKIGFGQNTKQYTFYVRDA